MKTTNWAYDFASLPRWNNREQNSWIYDEFYEIPQSDTLCCLYSICEVSMGNDQGFLAILKNKQKPELVLNIADGFNFCVNFSANSAGNLIFLQPSIYDRSSNRLLRPILILDLQKNCFSYVPTENYSPAYRIVEKSASVFQVQANERQRNNTKQLAALHGTKIQIPKLEWHEMGKLAKLPQMLLKQGSKSV